jgi:phospholipase/carboxylesterase
MNSPYKSIIFFTLFLCLQVHCFAQPDRPTYYFAEGFNYYEIVKGGKTDNKQLPLLVAFHYSSSKPEELISYYDSLQTPVRVIIPRGNYPKRNGYSYFPQDHYAKDSLNQMRTVKGTVDSIAVFLKAISRKYKAKPIVSGISQGGDISLLLAIHYPQLIRASFPLLGFIHRQAYQDLKGSSVKGVPVYMFQGEDDKIVPANYTRKEVSFLKNKFQITLSTYPQTGHDVTAAMEKDYSVLMRALLR